MPSWQPSMALWRTPTPSEEACRKSVRQTYNVTVMRQARLRYALTCTEGGYSHAPVCSQLQ
jgi:hypothetical protein